MNPYLIIAALVAILAAGAGGFKLGADHELAAQAREDKHVAAAIQAANTASAEAIAGIKVANTTIHQGLQREIRTNTIYAECKHSPVGLRNINDALAAPRPASDRKLPGADAAR
jgi:hypothetical protein